MPPVATNLTSTMGRMFLIGALATSLSCSDTSNPSEPVTRDPAALAPVPLDPAAPALATDSASFYAHYDKDQSVELYFQGSPGLAGPRLLRFTVDKKSLSRYPDGTRFGGKDSVLITIRVANPGSLAFDFEPSGLEFSRDTPAVLEVSFMHAILGPAGLGVHDETDLAIWMQEQDNQAYLRLNSRVNVLAREVEADIPGFSKYAVAY